MGRKFFLLFVALLFVLEGRNEAQSGVLVEIKNFHKKEVKFEGFTLAEPQTISIKVVSSNREHPLWTRAWILNSDTRGMVWDVRHASSKNDDRTTVVYSDTVSLPPGTYEVYYASFPYSFFSINGFSDLILELYGPERGAHARSAVGMAELPFNLPVEIEAEVEIA